MAEKNVLARMMELYQYDFSEFTGDDLNEDGCFGYRYLDAYWKEEGRFPFFIRIDRQLAGFVLVRSCSEYNDLADPHNIAEFFVMKKYRRSGIGKAAAAKIFDMFPGGWEIAYLNHNEPARRFWKHVIEEYTKGVYGYFSVEEKSGFVFDNSGRKI